MIVTKENGTIYTNGLTQAVIDFHKENGLTIAEVNRPLTYTESETEFTSREYIDDITVEEIKDGYEAIRGFLYMKISDPLFFKVQRGEIEESVWLNEIKKIKDENKPKIEFSNES